MTSTPDHGITSKLHARWHIIVTPTHAHPDQAALEKYSRCGVRWLRFSWPELVTGMSDACILVKLPEMHELQGHAKTRANDYARLARAWLAKIKTLQPAHPIGRRSLVNRGNQVSCACMGRGIGGMWIGKPREERHKNMRAFRSERAGKSQVRGLFCDNQTISLASLQSVASIGSVWVSQSPLPKPGALARTRNKWGWFE